MVWGVFNKTFMKSENILIGDWIFQNRKTKGLTQHFLANELRLTKGTISGWEKHRFIPKLLPMLKLSAIFQVPLPDQFTMNNIELSVKKYSEINIKDQFLKSTTNMLIVEKEFENCFGWIANENALIKIIKDDIVIISANTSPKPSDYVLAKYKDFLCLRKFKLLDPLNSNKFELLAENAQFPVIHSSKHLAKIVGVVKEVRRAL
jgi:transcriptional regulator with XRE-family HTH domain